MTQLTRKNEDGFKIVRKMKRNVRSTLNDDCALTLTLWRHPSYTDPIRVNRAAIQGLIICYSLLRPPQIFRRGFRSMKTVEEPDRQRCRNARTSA